MTDVQIMLPQRLQFEHTAGGPEAVERGVD